MCTFWYSPLWSDLANRNAEGWFLLIGRADHSIQLHQLPGFGTRGVGRKVRRELTGRGSKVCSKYS